MVHVNALINVLPTLAAVGLALTGVESVTGAVAHSPAHGANHRHLVARAAAAGKLGAQEKKRYVLRKRADGSTCRVKGAASKAASSSAVAPAGTSAAAPSPAAASASSSPSPAAEQAANADQYQAQEQAQAAPSPSPSPSPSPVPSPEAQAAAPSPSPSPQAQPQGNPVSAVVNTAVSNSHGKLGNAWPNGNWDEQGSPGWIGNYVGTKASWYYTWSPHNVGNADSIGQEFVPMLWGPHQVGDWHSLQASWPSDVKNALFFNEPNEASQCNMAAGDSVSYWMNDFLPVRQRGIRLGGAATTSAPSGLTWSQNFEKLCQQYGNSAADCTADFIPIHWYDVSAQGFQTYVEGYHNGMGGRNLWVTEYACQNFNGGAQCSEDQTWALHQQMAAWFDDQDYVERYSPFGAMRNMQGVNQFNALMNPDGSVTALGDWYKYSS